MAEAKMTSTPEIDGNYRYSIKDLARKIFFINPERDDLVKETASRDARTIIALKAARERANEFSGGADWFDSLDVAALAAGHFYGWTTEVLDVYCREGKEFLPQNWQTVEGARQGLLAVAIIDLAFQTQRLALLDEYQVKNKAHFVEESRKQMKKLRRLIKGLRQKK
jgi:hypothetical protein